MAAACVSAVLLFSALVSARVLNPPEGLPILTMQNDNPIHHSSGLSMQKYQHTDPQKYHHTDPPILSMQKDHQTEPSLDPPVMSMPKNHPIHPSSGQSIQKYQHIGPSLDPQKYLHLDPSGTPLSCDRCPAGTHVSAHCSPSSERVCAPCPPGTFTRGENGVTQCHSCRADCRPGQMERAPCTPTQDRVCSCPPGTFLSGDGNCTPHSRCPAGTRVRRRGSEEEDVVCKLCAKGTFSDSSDLLKCRRHQDCLSQGLVLLIPGTRETDNVCGSTQTFIPPPPPATAAPGRDQLQEADQTTPQLSNARHANLALSQSAGIQMRPVDEELQKTTSRGQDTSTLTPQDPHLVLGQQSSQLPPPGANRRTMDLLDSTPIHRASSAAGGGSASGGGSGGNSASGVSPSRPARRGSPRPSPHQHFDINEQLPLLTVLLLLLVLVVIVGCSVKRSSRVLKKGPVQDPSSILEKALSKNQPPGRQGRQGRENRERWIYYSSGQGVDILKLVSAHVGSHWSELYQVLAGASEREVTVFSNGTGSDADRAYAALQHWTVRDSDANLAKLINALHRQRRIDVVEKVRCVMEDNPQFDLNQLMPPVNGLSPIHRAPESPKGSVGGASVGGASVGGASVGGSSHSVGGASVGGSSVGGSSAGGVSVGVVSAVGVTSGVGVASAVGVEQSPMDRTRGFFPDESEPLLRCDSTSSKDSGLSRNGSFITKEKKDTVLRQLRLDPCDLQPIFDDMLHILLPEELQALDQTSSSEEKLHQLFHIAGAKSQEASQTLLDSLYSHLPDLL